MKGIFAAVFFGVFVGALGYEILNRTRPEVVADIRKKVADGVRTFFGTDATFDEDDDFDSEMTDEEIKAAA